MQTVKTYINNLKLNMSATFNLEELRDVLFQVNMDSDNLPGETKPIKILSLIIMLAQQGKLANLIEILRVTRPHAQWEDAPPANQQIQYGKSIKLDAYIAYRAMIGSIALMNEFGDDWADYASQSPSYPPHEYRRVILEENETIVSRQYGKELERITFDDFEQKLKPDDLDHINTLEKSLENHYALWKELYPQRTNLVDSEQEKAVNHKLDKLVKAIAQDLKGTLQFLELLGFDLDDHYLRYRELARQFALST